MELEIDNLKIGADECGYSWAGYQRKFVNNVARIITYRSMKDTKKNAKRFKSIIDMLINIVEKLETYTLTI